MHLSIVVLPSNWFFFIICLSAATLCIPSVSRTSSSPSRTRPLALPRTPPAGKNSSEFAPCVPECCAELVFKQNLCRALSVFSAHTLGLLVSACTQTQPYKRGGLRVSCFVLFSKNVCVVIVGQWKQREKKGNLRKSKQILSFWEWRVVGARLSVSVLTAVNKVWVRGVTVLVFWKGGVIQVSHTEGLHQSISCCCWCSLHCTHTYTGTHQYWRAAAAAVRQHHGRNCRTRVRRRGRARCRRRERDSEPVLGIFSCRLGKDVVQKHTCW